MKRGRFTEEHVIAVFGEAESGTPEKGALPSPTNQHGVVR